MLITASNISKSYDSINYIFEKINLGISFGDRVGIVGVNGCGKSTLLNILSGKDRHFEGSLQLSKSTRLGMLNQIATFASEKTLYSECKTVFKDINEIQEKIKLIEEKMKSNDTQELHLEYAHYISLLSDNEGFNIDYKIEKVLMGLGFSEPDFKRELSTFSGGEKRRALFTKIILEDNNVLFLDEPTNHLDIPAIEWVINFINSYYGAVVIVSHDKRFLNKTVNKIYEIEFGKGQLYRGNFKKYIIQKEDNLKRQQKEYETQQKHIKKTEEFIQKYMAGQRTKEAQGRKKRLDRVDRLEKPIFLRRNISIKDLLKCDRSGKEVVSLNNVDLGYSDKILIKNANVKIYREEKVAIIGNNGIGKTTLLKALIGELSPLLGEAKIGYNIKHVYFTQNTSDLNLDSNLINFISNIRPDLKDGEIRKLLAKFYFYGDKVFEDANILSGGEKTRIAILSFILQNANLLLLDEPTNHLDLFTIDSLGSILSEYPGTVLAISHDRNFIDMFAQKILLMQSDGILELEGNFSENEEVIIEKLAIGRLSKRHLMYKNAKENAKQKNNNKSNRKKSKNVNVYKISKIEEHITRLENNIKELKDKLTQSNVVINYKLVQEIQNDIEKNEKILKEKLMEWENLHN